MPADSIAHGTLETVFVLKPAARATSRIVGLLFMVCVT